MLHPTHIRIRGAREHNLQGVDVDLPRGVLTVVTGPSGSGKSSLVMNTVGWEGQRRYLETYSSFARQFLRQADRPRVDSVEGLGPCVPLSQATTTRSVRSTVGTITGLYDLLRLWMARLGSSEVPGAKRLRRQHFSFNSDEGACPSCRGLGVVDHIDPSRIVAHPDRSIRNGALAVSLPNGYLKYSQVTLEVLNQVCLAHGFDVDTPWCDLSAEQHDVVFRGSDRLRIPFGKHALASRLRWTGITPKPREEGTYKGLLVIMEQILASKRNPSILQFVQSLPCDACHGSRLRPEALAVTFLGRNIAQLAAMPIEDLAAFMRTAVFRPQDGPVGESLRSEIARRTSVLLRLGVGHLCLDRVSTSLSAGELQRLRIASIAAVQLSGLMFVVDEPSSGLHPRDIADLMSVLTQLRDGANTVLAVEHDPGVIRRSDWMVELGPGAGGREGGSCAAEHPGRSTGRHSKVQFPPVPQVGRPQRAPQQPAGRRCNLPCRRAQRGHWRVGRWEVKPGTGGHRSKQPHGAYPPSRRGGPNTHWTHPSIQSRHVHRIVGWDSPAIRRRPICTGSRAGRQRFLLQCRRRQMRGL